MALTDRRCEAGALDVSQGMLAGHVKGFFGRMKTEMFYARNWLSTNIEDFIAELNSYILWYNEDRIKISLGARSPIEYRRDLGLAA